MIELSIIIASYNSEKILSKVLASIQRQSFPKSKMETLLVDGGSTDHTLQIGKKFGCKIIKNPKVEPISAKILGFKNARGRYVMYVDHDEVLENKKCLSIKIEAMKSMKGIFAMVGTGYKNPKGYPIVNNYVNEFGDPFSFFIYRLSKDTRFFIKTMKARYKVANETKDYVIFDLYSNPTRPIMELIAMGTMIDAGFFKKQFGSRTSQIYFLGQAFEMLYTKSPYVGITKNDSYIHYSSVSIRGYLKKIDWRIKNNIYFADGIGKASFLGRNQYEASFRRLKKYLFIPYAFTFIFPFLDSIYLCLTRGNVEYMIHFPLTLYTAMAIVNHEILRFLGYKPYLKSYDGKKVIGK